jgi:hypothetical protein
MARPQKDPASRKTVDLRIPVTPDQKRLVMDAMAKDDREFAGWARSVLLDAAQALLAEKTRKSPAKSASLPSSKSRL